MSKITIDDLPERYRQQAKAQIANRVAGAVADQSIFVIPVAPMGKPRMTRRDKWCKRKVVARYWTFKDDVRAALEGVDLSCIDGVSWTAYMPMPKSWTKNKTERMRGTPHKQKPDRDNIDKAILDSLFDDDSKVWRGTLVKLWDDGGGARIEIVLDVDGCTKKGEPKTKSLTLPKK